MATRRLGAHVRFVLCGAGAVCRGLCRLPPQGPGHVHEQRCQSHWLLDDVVWLAPTVVLRHRRPGRSGVFTGQVRHPHRVVARLFVGQGQWLDRRLDHRLHHLGRAFGRSIGRAARVFFFAVLGFARAEPGHRHTARGSHLCHRVAVRLGRLVQHPHPQHRRNTDADAQPNRTQPGLQPARARPRFLALQPAVVA